MNTQEFRTNNNIDYLCPIGRTSNSLDIKSVSRRVLFIITTFFILSSITFFTDINLIDDLCAMGYAYLTAFTFYQYKISKAKVFGIIALFGILITFLYTFAHYTNMV